VLGDLADALMEGRSPRPMPAFEAAQLTGVSTLVLARTERLWRQVGTLHDAVARMQSSDEGLTAQGTFLAPLPGA
jgi:hypothetical protein